MIRKSWFVVYNFVKIREWEVLDIKVCGNVAGEVLQVWVLGIEDGG